MKNKILAIILLSAFTILTLPFKQAEASQTFSVVRMISPTVRIILRDNVKVWQELKFEDGVRIWVDDK